MALSYRTESFRTLAQRAGIHPDHLANPSQAELIRLKAIVDEFPERYPFDPRFPQAGRRRGSPAPAHTGPPEIQEPPPPPIYPPPIVPPPPPPITGPPTPPPPPGTIEGGCFTEGGQLINSGILNTLNIQTTVGASDRLLGPVVVTQIGFFCFNAAASTTLRAIIKVADDNSIAGGEATSGDRLSGYGSVRDFHPWNQWEYLYPYVTIKRNSFFLKFVCISEAVLGSLNWEFIVCLKRL